MKKKGLSKQQLLERQKLDDKKFNKTMLISFAILFSGVMSVLVFFTYWCDTRLVWRKIAWYGKEVPGNWTCMNGNNLQIHESKKTGYENKTYYFCSQKCFNHLVNHFKEVAIVADAFSGDSINKAEALIGLKEKGKPELVYFKNEENLTKYYQTIKKNTIK